MHLHLKEAKGGMYTIHSRRKNDLQKFFQLYRRRKKNHISEDSEGECLQSLRLYLSDLLISDNIQLNFKSYSQFCLHLSILYHQYATDVKKETQSCRSDSISFLPPAFELLQRSSFSSSFHNGHYSQPGLKKNGCHPS